MFDEPTRALIDALWTEHYDDAVRALRRLGVDEQDLDDVAVAVFVAWGRELLDARARREAVARRADGRLPPDLYRHCRQRAFNFRRSRRRSRLTLEPDLSCFGREDRSPAELRIQFAQLQDLVDDDEAWEVYVLHEVVGMTLAEISDLLGIDEAAVRRRLQRARKRIEEILAKEGSR